MSHLLCWLSALLPERKQPHMRPARRRPHRPRVERLEDRTVPSRFEVWVLDQSNTRDEDGNGTLDSGGTVYIYNGQSLTQGPAARARPDVIDLGGFVRDYSVARTGTAPVRPHMMFFNPDDTHAIISFVATGHVLFMDAATRRPVGVIDVGVQAHAAFPAPDGSYVIVADQNGKKLHRIRTDYRHNVFTLDATLDLATGTTPSGAPMQDPVLRPDTAPICPVIESRSRFTFVTLRGGGLFVIDTKAPTMRIVAEYDRATIHPDGCGGVEVDGKMYINSGGAGESDLYAFRLEDFDRRFNPPNTPRPRLVYSQDGGSVDSHGATLVANDRYLWVGDRFANKVVVVDTRRDVIVKEITLVNRLTSDPAPDLMGRSPDGEWVFVTLRGTALHN